MKIYDTEFNFTGGLLNRPLTDMIVLHHRAGNGDVLSLHNGHIKNGWSGIGYHFYVRKDGSIYRGRPIEKIGAHTEGYNSKSVGICFEGNFEEEKMAKEQIASGRLLIAHIRESYSNRLKVVRHSDLKNTLCPGKEFPFHELNKVSDDETVLKMYEDGIITFGNVSNWELFLSGKAKAKGEYIRSIIRRYQKKIG